MTPQDFVNQVIVPALTALELDTPAARELLLGTALQESGLRNIQQDGGPALGYFQMEPQTHDDLWASYLTFRQSLAAKVKSLLPDGTGPSADQLISCPQYAVAMARILYLRVPQAMPDAGDLDAQAAYYKQWYNTPGGAATTAEYVANWNAAMGTA